MKMKNTILLLVFVSLVVGCSATKKTTGNLNDQYYTSASVENDGSSFEKAIVIQARNENDGVSAEYAWIRQHYPGCKINGQSLVDHNKKPYDLIKIKTSDGRDLTIYFDISNFFGKF